MYSLKQKELEVDKKVVDYKFEMDEDGQVIKVPRTFTHDEMTAHVQEFIESKFPLPFVLVLVGYAMILLIDKVLIDSHDS